MLYFKWFARKENRVPDAVLKALPDSLFGLPFKIYG